MLTEAFLPPPVGCPAGHLPAAAPSAPIFLEYP